MNYKSHPQIKVPEFLQGPAWKEVPPPTINERAACSEVVFPPDFGYHLFVWVLPESHIVRYIIQTTSDEDTEPLDEWTADTAAQAIEILESELWCLNLLLENHLNRGNDETE